MYTSFKVWLLVVEDWVTFYTHTMPNNLGPAIVGVVSHLTIVLDKYSALETCSMLGIM